MNKIYRIKNAKENWKNKAKVRGSENCELRKKINRLEEKAQLENRNHNEEVERLKEEIKNALILVKSNKNKKSLFKGSNQKIRILCVQLLTVGVISFRSVPRILKLIGNSIGITQEPPHFTSVINWTLRASIGIYRNLSSISEPWIAIIDMSNTIGVRKVLVVKRVLLSKQAEKGKAIDLEDSECVGIASNEVWNGITVKAALDKIFSEAGIPSVILKDQGSDLKSGVNLYLQENKEKNIIVIDDIGHSAANALKAEFQKDIQFKKFLELIGSGSSIIRQTIVAWALPPKLRTKGRFQGITRLADWAQNMLLILDGKEEKVSQNELDILLKAFSGLIELRSFIEKFISTCEIVEQFLKILKQNGLNKKTANTAKKILSTLQGQSKVKLRLSNWLSRHQSFLLQLGSSKISLLVSSDIIESMFGKFKSIIDRGPSAELNRLIYIIPLLCGKRTEEEINQALTKCSHREMQKFIFENVSTTIRQRRMKILKNTKLRVPNLRNYKNEIAA